MLTRGDWLSLVHVAETAVKTTVCILALGATCAIGACGKSIDDAPSVTRPAAASIEDSLQEIARETGLTITDLSVPFDRFGDAPVQLRRTADVLSNGSPGLYVLRYYDDTLRHTQHIFVIHQQSRTYIKLNSFPNQQQTRVESAISSAEYDDADENPGPTYTNRGNSPDAHGCYAGRRVKSR